MFEIINNFRLYDKVYIVSALRPVSVGVSPGCHAHILERHVSKTTLFALNEEEREESSFTMVKPHGRCFPRGETE